MQFLRSIFSRYQKTAIGHAIHACVHGSMHSMPMLCNTSTTGRVWPGFRRYFHLFVLLYLRTMKLRLEFGGGLDTLFGGIKQHDLDLPSPSVAGKWTAGQLIAWARDNLLTERPELFVKGDSVRPGILVLINDCDWELSGELDSELSEGDTVVIISTLHGG